MLSNWQNAWISYNMPYKYSLTSYAGMHTHTHTPPVWPSRWRSFLIWTDRSFQYFLRPSVLLAALLCPKALWICFIKIQFPFFFLWLRLSNTVCPSPAYPSSVLSPPQAWMSALTTMAAAPTSAGTWGSVMNVTVLLDINSWTKRLVEVKKERVWIWAAPWAMRILKDTYISRPREDSALCVSHVPVCFFNRL